MMLSSRNSLKPALLCVALAAIIAAATNSFVSAFSVSATSRSASSAMKLKPATVESAESSTSGTTFPKASDTKAEEVARRYFDGVNKKDPVQLRSCFGESATIRDVCGLDSTVRTVDSEILVERCMEFVAAHPDCLVQFHYGPSEQRENDGNEGKDGTWVVAHWYENGHWSRDSCGIEAPNPPRPMTVEGQTRFKVASQPGQDEPKIQEFVVTRTFTEWENAIIDKRRRDAEEDGEKHYIFSSSDTSENENDELFRSMVITAEKAARAAGKVIIDAQESFGEDLGASESSSSTEQKVNIKDIVTKYDKEAQEVIEKAIRSKFPFHSFLGEEDVAAGGDASAQALADALNGSGSSSSSNDGSDYVWIVDPIDGTANFASGLDLCGVTVAVVDKTNGKALIGVIYDPHKNEMFVAVDGKGAFCNQKPIGTKISASGSSVSSLQDTIINAGCPADPNAFEASMRGVRALNSKCRGLRVIACSALTLAWVASNRLGAHFGFDLSSWDLVAGALLIREAGGSVTDIDGSPYEVKTRSMLVSSPDSNTGGSSVHGEILEVLKEADAVSFERAK
jgi:myo-inositol-1(or 4)-monophosphatase